MSYACWWTITYANGSNLDELAIAYGIVFSNFMSKGVFTFLGGTDLMIGMMEKELEKNGADFCTRAEGAWTPCSILLIRVKC